MNILSILSICINLLIILIILVRSPNEQSLQENLGPFQFFESSSKAESSIDNLIKLLTIMYFVVGLFFSIHNYFW
uniref:hypothetical protein n=1 Tax=Phaeostrophion irregulare TaxID=243268 RepID=UPI002E782322|nr:hypothetical protein V2492_pgp057 [Phaeostrophion irregulare]WAM64329.1 hypothetical protein [Phaeostrophion irregulare]